MARVPDVTALDRQQTSQDGAARSLWESSGVLPFWKDARLRWVLAIAIVARLAFLYAFADMPLLRDEVEYQEIATNLVEGRGFALNGQLTSWRPPLYPFFLAALYSATGTTDPLLPRAAQGILSLALALVVYGLGRRLFGADVAVAAAAIVALYPSFLFLNNHLLTEVLFTFLLTLTAFCVVLYLQHRGVGALFASGVSLALAALTREVVLPMAVFIVAVAMYVEYPRWPRMAMHTAVLGLALAVVVVPWAVRNTRLQGTFTAIATNGGPTFLSGNNEYTPAERPWQQHDFPRELRWRHLVPRGALSEGERQQLAYQKGLEFMRAHPGLTSRRAVIKAANVWGLERDIVGTFLSGGYGAAARIGAVPAAATIFAAYALTLLAGLTGLSFALAGSPSGRPFHLLVVALAAATTLAHALAFGHARYHLPLMPIIAVYAAYAWRSRRQIWQARRTPAFLVSCALAACALSIWVREVVFIDFERFVRGVLGS